MIQFYKEILLQFLSKLYSFYVKYSRFSLLFKAIVLSSIVMWLLLFNIYKDIPPDSRLKVDVTTLPILEDVITFGINIQEWPRDFFDQDSWFLHFLDFLAGLVYLMHFGFAWFVAGCLYLYYRKKTTTNGQPVAEPWTFLFTMGVLNLTAVAVQISWPTAPPWYVEEFGEIQPDYDTPGYEAGLARIDSVLGFGLFHSLYGQSPIVFGSFPSLHAAWPIVITTFVPGKALKILGSIYTAIVWWAAIYLNHHFLVDLIGGGIFATFSILLCTQTMALCLHYFKDKIILTKKEEFNINSLEEAQIELEIKCDNFVGETLLENNIPSEEVALIQNV